MIKVIFVENNEIKMSKEEFEKLLEETYKRGKDENYEAAYNKGYKDGYCNGHYWYNGITCTGGLNGTGTSTLNPWKDNITYCNGGVSTETDCTFESLQTQTTSATSCDKLN